MTRTTQRNARTKRETAPASTLRLIGGVRVSFSREEQTSTASQLESITDYCARHNATLVDHYAEDGVSGFNRKDARPELEKALRRIESGEANGLIVWKLDRLVRDLTHFMEIWNRIDAAGGVFVSVTEAFDTSTPMGRLMMVIVAAFAEMESDMKRQRMLRWNEYRITGGEAALPPGGPRPFGYTRNNGSLTVNNDEAAALVQAASMALQGASVTELAAFMQSLSLPDAPVTRAGIKATLTSPTIAGMRALDGDYVRGNWEAILDADEWSAVRARLLDPARTTNRNGGQPLYLLSSFVQCATCETNMHVRPHRDGPRFMCTRCNSSLHVAVTQDFVVSELLANVNREAWQALREQGHGYNPSLVDDIAAERATLNEMKDLGEITITEWRARIQANNARLERAHDAKPVDLPAVDDLHKAWPSLSLEDQRLVVRALVASVRITPWHRKRGGNAAERLAARQARVLVDFVAA